MLGSTVKSGEWEDRRKRLFRAVCEVVMMRKSLASILLIWAALGIAGSAAGAPADKAPTVTGTVSRVAASQRTVEVTLSDGSLERFFWNPETKINGTLTPGAAVTVRYTTGTDGKKLALQINVVRS
jgi:hypothetical protein